MGQRTTDLLSACSYAPLSALCGRAPFHSCVSLSPCLTIILVLRVVVRDQLAKKPCMLAAFQQLARSAFLIPRRLPVPLLFRQCFILNMFTGCGICCEERKHGRVH